MNKSTKTTRAIEQASTVMTQEQKVWLADRQNGVSLGVMGVLVYIIPTTAEHHAAIAKFGGWFWQRENNAGTSRLIPVSRDGIPYVADFIFVPASNVRRPSEHQGS